MVTRRLVIETRGDESRLICNDCQRPFLTIEQGELRFLSKHGSQHHENILTLEHLRMLIVELHRQLHPPERW
jgi:hypothetical protein